MRDLLYIVIIGSLCFLLWKSCQRKPQIITEEVIRVDTVHILQPLPSDRKPVRSVHINLPRMIFVRPDGSGTSIDTIPLSSSDSDSVQMRINIEQRVYRDSSYEAAVSGPVVGEYGPTLDYLNFTNRTTTTTITSMPATRTELTVEAGAFYTTFGSDIWAGASLMRHSGRFAYGGSVGYTLSGSPYIEARCGILLWSGKRGP